MELVKDGWSTFGESWKRRPLLNVTFLTIALSLLFITLPVIDIRFSQLFYVEGKGFPARSIDVLRTTRAIGQYFPLTFAIVVLVALLLKLIYPKRPCLFPARFTVYFTSLFLLGPGLLVNVILKPLWDRPRPINTVDFGGLHSFVDAWSMGGAFFANRSFVSGETAGVVCLLPLALFVLPEWRRCVLIMLSAFAIVISVNRIAFGAHFLSDVLISAALMFALAIGLWRLMYSSASNTFTDDALETTLTRAGLNMHQALKQLATAIERTTKLATGSFASPRINRARKI